MNKFGFLSFRDDDAPLGLVRDMQSPTGRCPVLKDERLSALIKRHCGMHNSLARRFLPSELVSKTNQLNEVVSKTNRLKTGEFAGVARHGETASDNTPCGAGGYVESPIPRLTPGVIDGCAPLERFALTRPNQLNEVVTNRHPLKEE